MRGKTVSGSTEVLNFSGFKPGLAYRMTEFSLYPSNDIGSKAYDLLATVSAGKTAIDPLDPNFNDEALVATSMLLVKDAAPTHPYGGATAHAVINDTFLITQNLILKVADVASSTSPVNWQCRFESVKMSGPEEAVTNYRQFAISDE